MPKKTHVKPTNEELQAGIDKSLEELESDTPEEEPTEPSIPPDEPEESPPEETTDEVVEETPEPEPEPDYKKKFTESAREAQILHAKNKKVNEALDKATSLPDPTDEELVHEYPDWEVMSDFEKRMARESLANTRRLEAISEIAKESKNIEAWNENVDKFVDDPKTLIDNPELEGNQDEFRVFAAKPTRRGVDFEDLVSAFLYQRKAEAPPPNKGKMFETGTGGPSEKSKVKAGMISLEEANNLRKNNYSKYREMVKEGKIDLGNI